ncbi:hypothetical protein CBL_20811 [Carabus blaptoides fortunei]
MIQLKKLLQKWAKDTNPSPIKGKLTLKRLSGTRWSARDDACRSFYESWSEIIESLSLIEDDSTEKAISRSVAKGLRTRLERLESAFMSEFWGSLLDRLNKTSKKLQCVDIDITMCNCHIPINHCGKSDIQQHITTNDEKNRKKEEFIDFLAGLAEEMAEY